MCSPVSRRPDFTPTPRSHYYTSLVTSPRAPPGERVGSGDETSTSTTPTNWSHPLTRACAVRNAKFCKWHGDSSYPQKFTLCAFLMSTLPSVKSMTQCMLLICICSVVFHRCALGELVNAAAIASGLHWYNYHLQVKKPASHLSVVSLG